MISFARYWGLCVLVAWQGVAIARPLPEPRSTWANIDRAKSIPGNEALSQAVLAMLDPDAVPPGLRAGPAPDAVCRTPLLLRALTSFDKLSPHAQALLASTISRPPSTGEVAPAGDRVWVHAPPGASAAWASDVSRAIGLVQESLSDPTFPSAAIDVYAVAPAGAMGSIVWDGLISPQPVGIMISPILDPEVRRLEIVHQLVHLWQLDQGPGMRELPPSWLEGIAVYVAYSTAKDVSSVRSSLAQAVAPSVISRNRPADSLDPEILRARASLAAFLCEGSGGGLALLNELHAHLAQGETFSRALDDTLRAAGRGSSPGFYLEHSLWLTLSGELDAGREGASYFSFGDLMPPGQNLDLESNRSQPIVLATGAYEVARLDSAPHDGGFWITVRSDAIPVGDGATPYLRGAVIVRSASQDGGIGVAPIPMIADGSLRIGVPARNARDIHLVLSSTAPWPLAIEVRVEHDPVFPYVLSSFVAEPTDSGVLIQWTVTEEQGISGWRIMRSRDPSQGFTAVSSVLIPGRGDAREPLTYYFLDQTTQAGQRYFYYLEGASVWGFAQPSFMVSARAGGL